MMWYLFGIRSTKEKIDNEPVIVCTLVPHTCFPWEVKPGGSGVQNHPHIHSVFDTSQPGLRNVLEQNKTKLNPRKSHENT